MTPEQQAEHNVRCMERALQNLATGLVPRLSWDVTGDGTWSVPSASGGRPHRTRVQVHAGHVLVHCDCQAEGRWGGWPGITPCWHGAAACAAEAAAGRVVSQGGRWVPTEPEQTPDAATEADDDPFKGLPR